MAALATLMQPDRPGPLPGAVHPAVRCDHALRLLHRHRPGDLAGLALRAAAVRRRCRLAVYVIRTWGGYPEGVGFAILLMNACTPMIDHYLKPRIYGRDRRGKPLEYASRCRDNAEKAR
jgi:hypothetical protein